MDLAEVRKAYYEYSGKASDVARTLGLSAIAIIWVFKNDTSHGPEIPAALFMPGALVVGALIFDLLQYVLGAAIWGSYGRIKERSGTNFSETFLAPRWLNWPTFLAFALKIACIGIAYFYLLRFLWALVPSLGPGDVAYLGSARGVVN